MAMDCLRALCQEMSHVTEDLLLRKGEASTGQWKLRGSEGQQIELNSNSKIYYLYDLGQSF